VVTGLVIYPRCGTAPGVTVEAVDQQVLGKGRECEVVIQPREDDDGDGYCQSTPTKGRQPEATLSRVNVVPNQPEQEQKASCMCLRSMGST
jgi:hypothetical protein